MSDKRFIDVSHTVKAGMLTYPGIPAPTISAHLTHQESRPHYAPGTEFHLGKIEMAANTGTYLDAPYHRFKEREDLSALPLESLADLDGLVVRARDHQMRAIGPEVFEGFRLAGRAVLIHTGWSVYWGTEGYFEGHPYLTEDAVQCLIDGRVALVGIDSLNIDDTEDGRRPAHTRLLERGIPIVEHLTRLDQLPEAGFQFFAVPVKVAGLGSFPVRAFGMVTG
jgi:kynurenine formamidase